ncbi:MAG TPA: hypothetical protein VM600_00505 [Actinomycetota bacterium]|nr:hypothetical protein [Actinomycetota bacterium]
MSRAIRRTLLVAAATLATVAVVPPASASPSGTKVAKVYQMPCADEVCRSTTDRAISDSGIARGAVQVHVTSSSRVGLDQVRLEVRYGGAWVCLKKWSTSAESFSSHYNWNTATWPGGCDGDGPETGRLMENGTYLLHVVATERVSGDVQTSAAFEVRVNNRASAPRWASTPAVKGDDKRKTEVTISWLRNPEPDVTEYHFIRANPYGGEIEFAVSAARPQAQGCSLDGDTYTCTDADFASEDYGGTYEYALIALRTSPSTAQRCALPPQDGCIESPVSDQVMTAKVVEPIPPTPVAERSTRTTPNTRARPAGRRSSSVLGSEYVNPREYYSGTFDKELPYSESPVYVGPGSDGSTLEAAGDAAGADAALPNSDKLPALAGGLILLMAALHIGRALRDPSA